MWSCRPLLIAGGNGVALRAGLKLHSLAATQGKNPSESCALTKHSSGIIAASVACRVFVIRSDPAKRRRGDAHPFVPMENEIVTPPRAY